MKNFRDGQDDAVSVDPNESLDLDYTPDAPKSAFGRSTVDRNASEYAQVLQAWLAHENSPFRRFWNRRKHGRHRNES